VSIAIFTAFSHVSVFYQVNYPLSKVNGLPVSSVYASVGAEHVPLAHRALALYYLHWR